MDPIPHLADDPAPAASVLITHGYGEHSGRYRTVIAALNAAGLDAWTYDQHGHGTAEGPRARVDVERLIIDQLEARQMMAQQIAQRARSGRIILFGHSMGGLIAAASALLRPHGLSALVLTGPAFTPLPATPTRLARALLPLARLAPGLPAATLDDTALSRDPEVVRAYREDPLVHHGQVPLLTGVTMVVQGANVLANAGMLAVPTLILHGTADRLAAPNGSRTFAERASMAEVDLRMIDGAYHEVLNEPQGPGLLADIVSWMGARV